MPRPNHSERTRAQIVEAAVALLDAEGLEALSTRRLAAELGVRGPTLYHYFADKNSLLEAVRDRIAAEIWTGVESRLADIESGDWERVLRGYVDGALSAMARHPRAIGLMALGAATRQSTLRGYETMLTRLTECGWPLGLAWQIFLAAENLMLSAALEAGQPAFAPSSEQTAELPLLRALAGELAADPSLDDGYETGLDALIAGIGVTLGAYRNPDVRSPH
ncbi:TetR/AcrR family transcriptional regulator [Planotetraspora phitsanulokensis]|uniref:TetR family transcriptional regulator n=1 Tax=Planotetraspora phitsanulokensis TaxID=575192 RepID=A0A8J3UCI3_9ACTN|nr:TetR family transcriptional regulator [Planotetraspora phitsanulokensis]GII36540.1 TetR family transcriptional regulator [Planotetraspora phitsanulokensis]